MGSSEAMGEDAEGLSSWAGNTHAVTARGILKRKLQTTNKEGVPFCREHQRRFQITSEGCLYLHGFFPSTGSLSHDPVKRKQPKNSLEPQSCLKNNALRIYTNVIYNYT